MPALALPSAERTAHPRVEANAESGESPGGLADDLVTVFDSHEQERLVLSHSHDFLTCIPQRM